MVLGEELLSMFVFDIISPDVRHKHREDFFAQLASSKENIGYESRISHEDRSIRVISGPLHHFLKRD